MTDLVRRLKLECMCTNITCVACEARERLEQLEADVVHLRSIVREQALYITRAEPH